MRRNWDLSMMVLIIILAFSSFRSGAFSSTLGFTEFDILEKYRKSFKDRKSVV